MKPQSVVPYALLALAALLGGCTILGDGLFASDKVDYRGAKVAAKPLEVPPDLSQLSRESRYQPQGGVVSAAAAGTAPGSAVPTVGAAGALAPGMVAVAAQGDVRVERAGQQRWLAVSQTPEQLWPVVRSFWEQRGFTLDVDNPQVGVMETNWSENRGKLPDDAVRNTIGRLLNRLYDTGERDRYRTRIERTAAGSEIYISHRGAEEVYADARNETTTWRARANDPQLEAEFLSKLMVVLSGVPEPSARSAVTAAAPAASAATPTAAAAAAPLPQARMVAGSTATSLVVEEPFDRAWRRVGLALDRGGFTVEDRDRAAGLYYVRYVDPKTVGQDEPNWFTRFFRSNTTPGAQRLRIAVRGSGDKTNVSVQKSTGEPELGENAQRIVALLTGEMR